MVKKTEIWCCVCKHEGTRLCLRVHKDWSLLLDEIEDV